MAGNPLLEAQIKKALAQTRTAEAEATMAESGVARAADRAGTIKRDFGGSATAVQKGEGELQFNAMEKYASSMRALSRQQAKLAANSRIKRQRISDRDMIFQTLFGAALSPISRRR